MKSDFFTAALAAVIFCALSVTGCVSTNAQINSKSEGEFGKQVLIPAMEFETRGLVFTETQFTVISKGDIDGMTFTYQQLLKEAQKLGADAIINVVIDIDKRIEHEATGQLGYNTNTVETWYGSALAIKYTRILKTIGEERVYLNGNRDTDTKSGPPAPRVAGDILTTGERHQCREHCPAHGGSTNNTRP
ncbi:MAG: hypothetical protein LBQ69_06105 [Treponema sp.]|jgi:hypothetical protein|nr:hypothetical protein [Treponema sp.]